MLRQSEQTDRKILEYIIDHKTPPGEKVPGRLQKSLIEIARSVGVSVSSVHRALDRLKTSGVIFVRPPTDKRLPNIIEYVGMTEAMEMTSEPIIEMKKTLNQLTLNFEALAANYMTAIQRANSLVKLDQRLLDAIAGFTLVQENMLPDGSKIMVLKPKIAASDTQEVP